MRWPSLLPNEPHAYTDGLAVMSQLLELGLLEIVAKSLAN